MIEIELPYPPSLNTYWRKFRGRMVISKSGRYYAEQIKLLTSNIKPFGHRRLKVEIKAFMPDRRKRDLDNLGKAPLDALQKAHVFNDDSQIDDLRIVRAGFCKLGRLVVMVSEMGGGDE